MRVLRRCLIIVGDGWCEQAKEYEWREQAISKSKAEQWVGKKREGCGDEDEDETRVIRGARNNR